MPIKKENRNKLVLSSTHVDRHGGRVSKEALEQAVESINSSIKPRLGLEHDMSFPPLGRINDAELVKGEDGEFYLTGHQEYYEIREQLTLKDGSILIKEGFAKEGSKFTEINFEPLEQLQIKIDRVNFKDYDDAEKFINELKEEAEIDFTHQDLIRKSFIPDPELVIELSTAAAIYFFSKELLPKLAGKLSEEISVDIVNFYKFLKVAVTKMSKRAIPKNRPITYLIQVNGDINIDLIIKSPKPDEIVTALTKEKLNPLVSKIESLNTLFGVDKVQFVFNEKKEWEFNYALTSKGEAIGTKKSFNKRDKAFKELAVKMIEEAKKKNDK